MSIESIKRFFSGKTEFDLNAAARATKQRNTLLETPHGLASFIGDRQKEVDLLQARSSQFISEIGVHFGAAGKFLSKKYPGRTKVQNIEEGANRRLGIRWGRDHLDAGNTKTEIAFVYTETKDGRVRIDYICATGGGGQEVINDNYDPVHDNVYKDLKTVEDQFRSIRRYDTHAEFIASGDRPPSWFVQALNDNVKPI